MTVDDQPTLRERQAQQVAAEIRRAFVRLVNAKGPNGFSLRDVATEAGVSERTLYRYYPGRAELVQALIDNENAAMEAELGPIRATLADLVEPEAIARVFEIFEEYGDLVRASGLLRAAGDDGGGSAARTDQVRQAIGHGFGLPEDVMAQMVGLVRVLSSSMAWMRMTDPDVGLDSREAGYAAQWAIEVLIDAARREEGPLRPEGGAR